MRWTWAWILCVTQPEVNLYQIAPLADEAADGPTGDVGGPGSDGELWLGCTVEGVVPSTKRSNGWMKCRGSAELISEMRGTPSELVPGESIATAPIDPATPAPDLPPVVTRSAWPDAGACPCGTR